MEIGTAYTVREFCDGQSLASPGRWPPKARVYPTSPAWLQVAGHFRDFADKFGSSGLLVKLALGKVKEMPFDANEVARLKEKVVGDLAAQEQVLVMSASDRSDVPIDFRLLQLLLKTAEDPEEGLRDFALGVRVGPGVRLPRLPALYAKKRRWKLPEQNTEDEEREADTDGVWRSNYASLPPMEDKVIAVLEDQATRGQVLKLSETEARHKFPGLVVASLGAQRKEKPGGEVTARVLFDGTNGIFVNKRTKVRDQCC